MRTHLVDQIYTLKNTQTCCYCSFTKLQYIFWKYPLHWFISVIQSWLKPQAMKSNQGQPGTRGPLVLLTMTALQADNFISCFVLSFNWKCHILVKVIKENDVHYQNVKSTKMIIEYLSPELLCNWHQNRCTECMSDEDCPDCGEVDVFLIFLCLPFLWHKRNDWFPQDCVMGRPVCVYGDHCCDQDFCWTVFQGKSPNLNKVQNENLYSNLITDHWLVILTRLIENFPN